MSFKYKDDFAVFILSHERADTITTVDMLMKNRYTGKWYVVIDNLDRQSKKYKSRFGNHVIVFDKKEYAKKTDLGDNGNDLRIGVLARNAIIDIAKEKGFKYHLQLDDDYKALNFRYLKNGKLSYKPVKELNKLFEISINFLKNTDVTCFSFAVGGDLIGGKDNKNYWDGLLRKCMNTFFIKSEKHFYFNMRMNDDVSTYVLRSIVGDVFLSCMYVQISMSNTQSGDGGMTDIYLDSGTYWKSFYSLMCAPSCCGIRVMNTKNKRIHHYVKKDNCFPKIIEEKYKK